jgi:hypothetical protein
MKFDGADLRASVGNASRPVRLLIAAVLGGIAAATTAGIVIVIREAPFAIDVVAIVIFSPIVLGAGLAAIFAAAPLSRFGNRIAEKDRRR